VGLFGDLPDPILQELRALDVNNLTPLQALAKLAELRARALREAEGGADKEN